MRAEVSAASHFFPPPARAANGFGVRFFSFEHLARFALAVLLRCLGQKSRQVVDPIRELRQRTHRMRGALGLVPGRILEKEHAIVDQLVRRTRDRRSLGAGQVGIGVMANHAVGHVHDSPLFGRRHRLRRTARRDCIANIAAHAPSDDRRRARAAVSDPMEWPKIVCTVS